MEGAANITGIDEIVARSGMTKLGDLMAMRAIYANWLDVVRGSRGVIRITKSIRLDKRFLKYNYHGREIIFHYKNHSDLQEIVSLIYENFEKEQYKRLNVKDKTVIDVGANIGDSAIYFALNGARHVYAFEPYPYAYSKAVENIRANHLEDRITILNEGLGAKESSMLLGDDKSVGGSKLRESQSGKRIKIATLGEVVDRYSINAARLKIDCEGCEYGIILNVNDRCLNKFDGIFIEYHYGYMNLEGKLREAGFKTMHSRPRMAYYDRSMRMGVMLAKNEDRS